MKTRSQPGRKARKPGYNLASLYATPWRQHKIDVRDAQGAWIATTGDADTARFIAAAPELLAALEQIAGSGLAKYGADARFLCGIARAAIAKAKGQA